MILKIDGNLPVEPIAMLVQSVSDCVNPILARKPFLFEVRTEFFRKVDLVF